MLTKKHEIIAVTGMTGVGKDYLVDRANQEHGREATNLGTLIGEELATDRDLMMETVDPARIRAAQFIVYRKVVEKQPLIVTCHAIRPQGDSYGYDLELERIFNPSCYVFVTAPPEVIAERIRQRNQTGERKSPELAVSAIEYIQQTKLNIMGELTSILDCEMLILNNVNEELDGNIQRLGERIGNLGCTALFEP